MGNGKHRGNKPQKGLGHVQWSVAQLVFSQCFKQQLTNEKLNIFVGFQGALKCERIGELGTILRLNGCISGIMLNRI